ncbi:uncharacterized protein DS421_15g515300 [Arachis hypogaea]|nr:uncharacterized protein DS421_15g515300 [Arachis hypogaea]
MEVKECLGWVTWFLRMRLFCLNDSTRRSVLFGRELFVKKLQQDMDKYIIYVNKNLKPFITYFSHVMSGCGLDLSTNTLNSGWVSRCQSFPTINGLLFSLLSYGLHVI